ncbi:MAG: cupredoxin domain-containing protein [Bacteroidota bacterium]
MKRIITTALLALGLFATVSLSAQNAKTVKLKQTPGEFAKENLTLKAGQPYVFQIANKGVDHPVGFVIAPKGKTDQANHIQSAYLSKTITDGEKGRSKEVVLEAGEYVYFCPLNPTPQYTITVK